MPQWAVRGIRGATCAAANEREAIISATRELIQAIVDANDLAVEDIASAILTVTEDLDAEFPAVGAREAGLTDVALLCAREVNVPGGTARCIRALLHVNTSKSQNEMHHVYLREARALRPDLAGRP